MMRKFFPSETYNRRLLLMAREVVLAVAVTIAALVFIFAVSQPEPPEQIGVTAQRTVQK